MTKLTQKVVNILNNEYGVSLVNAPKEAILWACEKMEDPAKALKSINKDRKKYGLFFIYSTDLSN